jgi:hypothetical protein
MQSRKSTAGVLPAVTVSELVRSDAARIVTIVAIGQDGTPDVRLDDGSVPVPARLAVRTSRERLELAAAEGRQAVAVFEGGDPSLPIIVGFIEVPEPEPASSTEPPPVIEADVDGRRVRVTAQDEIVLECGQASITLRRNGRVIVRGTYVETRSEGTNRIKGGQVQIN